MRTLADHSSIEKLCVLICAYNEEATIGEVIAGAQSQNPNLILVVDDGSQDRTGAIAEKAGAVLLTQPENLGKGAALKRGFQYAMKYDYDAVIVLDADGQHDPNEIVNFVDAYERTGIPVLIGNRMADTGLMPLIRKWTNRFMCYVLNKLVKIYVADPPCGYRFYKTDVLRFIMSHEKRFAFEFDILIHAALRRIRIDSVRISTIYRKKHSHISPMRDAVLLFRCVIDHLPDRPRRAQL